MLTIGLYEPNSDINRHLQELASTITECSFVEIVTLTDLDELSSLLTCDLVLVAIGGPADCELIRAANEQAPLASWVAMLAQPDPTLAQLALRSGCGAVVVRPLDRDFLATLLASKTAIPESGVTPAGAPLARGAVIGVWSYQGGVGKTTIAANLATGIAEKLSQPVCLIEVTAGPSQLAKLAGAQSKLSLRDLSELDGPLNLADLHNLVTTTPYQLGLLTAPTALDGTDIANTSSWISRAGARLRECPSISILDLPTGWSELTHRALQECTAVVLVTPPTTFSIDLAADAWTTVGQSISTAPTLHLALNAIQDEQRWSSDALKKRFHAESCTTFPHDYKTVNELWRRGRPLLRQDKGSRWRGARDELVQQIAQDLASF